MSYLSMRFVRAVKNLPEYNSAEDINPQKMYKLFLSLLKVNTDARIDASVWLLSREESYFTFQLLFKQLPLFYSFVFPWTPFCLGLHTALCYPHCW